MRPAKEVRNYSRDTERLLATEISRIEKEVTRASELGVTQCTVIFVNEQVYDDLVTTLIGLDYKVTEGISKWDGLYLIIKW